jgi:hypothetical protein
MTLHQRREALHRMDAGESIVDIARTFGVDRATLYRMQAGAQKVNEKEKSVLAITCPLDIIPPYLPLSPCQSGPRAFFGLCPVERDSTVCIHWQN